MILVVPREVLGFRSLHVNSVQLVYFLFSIVHIFLADSLIVISDFLYLPLPFYTIMKNEC